MSWILLNILAETPGVTIYGITDSKRLEEPVPTCAFTMVRKFSPPGSRTAGRAIIFVWEGSNYAFEATTRLMLEDSGGLKLS